MKIEFVAADAEPRKHRALAVVAFEGGALSPPAREVDQATSGAIGRGVAGGRFMGKAGQSIDLIAPAGLDAVRILVVGGGDETTFDADVAEAFAANAYKALKTSGVEALEITMTGFGAEVAARAALGARLASYRFDKYRTTEAADKKPSIKVVRVVCDDPKAAKAAFKPLDAVADGVFFTRDLVAEPANILHPEEFAKRVKKLEKLGCKVEILGEKEMEKLGMGSLLGVGQGSRRESQLAVIQWQGADDKDAQPIAFVGKGVCFDTGGISLKPPEGMEDMKWDMGGAGAVAGLMCALAGRKAKANVVGILGLVENMPDGNAPEAGRRGDLHVRPDHRGDQHRCGRPPRARRRALVLPGSVQAAVHGGPRHADRRHHRGAGS